MEDKKSQHYLKSVIRLMRPKHWLKNGLLFVSVIFSGRMLQAEPMIRVILGFFAFSLISSAVYVLNDIRDVEADRQHEVKRNRPIASGAVSIPAAYGLMAILTAAALGLNYLACKSAWGGG